MVLLGASIGFGASAGGIDNVAVSKDKGQYKISVSSHLDIAQPELRKLLTNYPLVAQSNPAVKSLEVVSESPAGVTRIKATLKVCVWFYCRQLKQTQDMTLLGNGHLHADIIPSESDFKHGHADWRMMVEGEGSRLLFSAALTPDFWVPPLIGPYVIKKKMREEAIETVLGLEHLAANPVTR